MAFTNNAFAGVLGAMAQQVNMGAVPMSQMTGMVPNSLPVNGSIHVTDVEALDNELALHYATLTEHQPT